MKNLPRLSRWCGAAVGAVALTVAGCSTSPVGPSAARVQDPAFVQGAAPEIASLGTSDGVVAPTDPVERTVCARVEGGRGGVLTVGNWVMTVPAGAFSGVGEVSMTLDPTQDAVVDLHIVPESLNQFRVPVRLQYQLRNAGQAVTTDLMWWDPSTSSWLLLNSTPDVRTLRRTTDLSHFSRYAAAQSPAMRRRGDKAGW